MKIGYVRVSKNEQNQNLQQDALKLAGCELLFEEKISGCSKDRPEFKRMLDSLRDGDIVVVWRIDRLGRTTFDLIQLMQEWRIKGVEFQSLKEGIDTTTPMGRLWFNLSAVFAENEREIIRERTMAGLVAARARGRIGGRPKGLTERAKKMAKTAKVLYESGQTVSQILSSLDIGSSATLYRYLRSEGVTI